MLSKSVHSFVAWNTRSDGQGDDYLIGDYEMPAENLELFAQWTKNPTYTITYDANGGLGDVPVDENLYEAGQDIQIKSVSDLSFHGYSFKEWNSQSDGMGTSYDNESQIMPSQNLTLYAIWNIIPLEGIEIIEQDFSILQEDEFQLEIKPIPETALLPELEFVSNNTNSLSVDSDGLITAGIPGSADILVRTIDHAYSDLIQNLIVHNTFIAVFEIHPDYVGNYYPPPFNEIIPSSLPSEETYELSTKDIIIDWGDNTRTILEYKYSSHWWPENPGHYFEDSELLTVKLAGKGMYLNRIPEWQMENLKEIRNCGDLVIHSSFGRLKGLSDLIITAKDSPEFLEDISYAFSNIPTLVTIDSNKWETSHVTNMRYLFAGSDNFESGVENLDTGNVSNMEGMFSGALAFDEDKSAWDISSVLTMKDMFLNVALSTEN